MKSYNNAIHEATQLCNMPDPDSEASRFIYWAEDICELIRQIYGMDYNEVAQDFQQAMGFLEEDDESD